MKRISIFILCLAFASLACLSTSAAVIKSAPRDVAATRLEIGQFIAEPVDLVGQLPQITPQLCARVVAVDALHLRNGRSADDIVLTWLRSGDVVQLLDQADADWRRVQAGDVIGFARSSFLELVRCDDE